MGCFDRVSVRCPELGCSGTVMFQSKGGDCIFDVFTGDNVPPIVAEGIHHPGECSVCAGRFTAQSNIPTNVQVTAVPIR